MPIATASFRNAPVKSIFNRTKVDGRQKTAKKFFTAIKHANTQLGSLSLYGKPYFVLVFVVAAATMATCQYVALFTTIHTSLHNSRIHT